MPLLTRRMKRIRKFLGLSQRSMSKLCGFGENQWRLYENGDQKPNPSNRKLIELTFRPSSLQNLMECSPCEDIPNFDDAYQKIHESVKEIERKAQNFKNIQESKFIDYI